MSLPPSREQWMKGWRSVGIDPHILNTGTHTIRRLGVPQSRSERFERGKNVCPCRKLIHDRHRGVQLIPWSLQRYRGYTQTIKITAVSENATTFDITGQYKHPYLPILLSKQMRNYKMFKMYGVKNRGVYSQNTTHIQQRILLWFNDNHKNTRLRRATSINSSATSTFLYSFHSQKRGCCYKYEEKYRERLSLQLSSRQP
jgi:hypothetical protein